MARLKDYYVSTVAPAMMKKFGYKSLQVRYVDMTKVGVSRTMDA